MLKKIERMHNMFGKTVGHKCYECSNFVSGRYHDKILHKCSVYGLTHSEASDWRLKYDACGMFNKEYEGVPIIRRNTKEEKAKIQVEGQTELWE